MSTKDEGWGRVIYVTSEDSMITKLTQYVSTGNLFWDIVLLFSAAFIVWLTWAVIKAGRNLNRRYKELLASGFNPHYLLSGTILFAIDRDRRELAVVYSDATFRYRFDQIHEWRHEWETRNGMRTKNKVIINVLDPDHPQHVVKNLGTRECEQWHARMSALLNMAAA